MRWPHEIGRRALLRPGHVDVRRIDGDLEVAVLEHQQPIRHEMLDAAAADGRQELRRRLEDHRRTGTRDGKASAVERGLEVVADRLVPSGLDDDRNLRRRSRRPSVARPLCQIHTR